MSKRIRRRAAIYPESAFDGVHPLLARVYARREQATPGATGGAYPIC
ncbi:hypothetical protein [Alkalilimnicola ehrlichii]|nr:hypothetical protein [Alkalilimnicola ehrlichii]